MPSKKPKTNLRVKSEDVFTYGIDRKTKLFTLYVGGQALPENQINNLKEEIKFIERTEWWKICNETLRQKAIEKAIYKSTNFDDMRNAKEMLEVLKLINEINLVIKSWKAPVKGQPMPMMPIER